MSSSKKLSISLLISLVGFPQISETIYTPALPDVTRSLETSAYLTEATLAIYFLGFALGVLTWGAVSDSIGRKPTMLLGICLYGLFTTVCGFCTSIEMLLFCRVFQAFGASVGSVITQTILRDAYDGTERAKLFSIITGAIAFSPAVGPLLGGFITQYVGWRMNFFTLSLLSILLFVWTYLGLRETRPEKTLKVSFSQLKAVIQSMLSSRSLWGHIFLISGTNGIVFGFYQEAPFVFIEQLGMAPSAYGCFGLFMAGASILASRFSYRQSLHWSGLSLIRLGSCCILLGGFLFNFLALSGKMQAAQFNLMSVILVLFLIFFGIGLIIPSSLSSALKPYQIAGGMAGSIFGGCYYAFIATFTWLMSMLHNGTTLPLPLYVCLLGGVIAVAAYMVKPEGECTEGASIKT